MSIDLARGEAVTRGNAAASAKRKSARLDILFLAQLPPPLHGQSMTAMRVHDVLQNELGHRVTHLWGGGAAANADVGRRSLAKYMGFLSVVLTMLWWVVTCRRYDAAYMGVAPWSHALPRDALLAMLAKIVTRRVLVHVHGNGMERMTAGQGVGGWLVRRTFRDTEILAVTGGIASAARDAGIFSRVSAVANTAPDPGEPGKRADGVLRVVTLCNLDPRKGVLEFVDVVEASAADTRLTATIAGGATGAMTLEGLRAHIDTIAPVGMIDACGPVDASARDDLLGGADVFLYLSRHDLAPLSLIEAMSHGCVPIVLDIGGMREMVGSELTRNVLSPELDRAALVREAAGLVHRYGNDPAALGRDRAAARRRYREAFAPERFRRELEGVFVDE